MTTTSMDPTGSKNMANQLQKFMSKDYNVSTSNVDISASAPGGLSEARAKAKARIATVQESDDDSSDDGYSQSMTVSGSA